MVTVGILIIQTMEPTGIHHPLTGLAQMAELLLAAYLDYYILNSDVQMVSGPQM